MLSAVKASTYPGQKVFGETNAKVGSQSKISCLLCRVHTPAGSGSFPGSAPGLRDLSFISTYDQRLTSRMSCLQVRPWVNQQRRGLMGLWNLASMRPTCTCEKTQTNEELFVQTF